jgi:hypothetical protein
MRSVASLRQWVTDLLPHAGHPAREGARQLTCSLLTGFTANLCGLARHSAGRRRGRTAASQRQYFFRWLQRPRWIPEAIYARLLRRWPPELQTAPVVPLLIDCTILGEGWNVLQVSVPFARRALPVYRAVVPYRTPTTSQKELLDTALTWLKEHLPGAQGRYVLILDRGFPSHELLRQLQTAGWRYVVRIGRNWKLTHAEHTGLLQDAVPADRPLRQCQWFPNGVLGNRDKGTAKWSRSHVVVFTDPRHAEAWVLATSEGDAETAVAFYRQRMQIEAEFRDIKGPLGMDHLEQWQDGERVARLLVWVAVYEWRLAWLWVTRPLAAWGRRYLQIGGPLSWINITRQWVQQHWRSALGPPPTTVRESP